MLASDERQAQHEPCPESLLPSLLLMLCILLFLSFPLFSVVSGEGADQTMECPEAPRMEQVLADEVGSPMSQLHPLALSPVRLFLVRMGRMHPPTPRSCRGALMSSYSPEGITHLLAFPVLLQYLP